jgi:predicted nucleic acid-binding protein
VDAALALAAFRKIGVRLILPDEQQDQLALGWTLRLKRVAAYDSYYLALAESRACELWTADRRLFNAANVPWVHLVESSP